MSMNVEPVKTLVAISQAVEIYMAKASDALVELVTT